MVYTKQKQIKELKEGEPVKDIFVVKAKTGVNSYAKGFRISLILSDSSGLNLEYTYWGDTNEDRINEIYKNIKSDSVVLIQGKVNSYRDKLQLSSNAVEEPVVLKSDEYDADFISKSKKDVEMLSQEIKKKLEKISDDNIKNFVLKVYSDIENNFKNHPGAMAVHHNWRGGLLEHTYEVMKICENCKNLFDSLDENLLIAGAFLHDIGKLEELEMTSKIKRSQRGHLIGHLTLGIIKVNECLEKSNLGELTKDKFLHIITSHHGKEEFGSPKKPMFPEALAIYYADELSSKISAMINFKEEMQELTEDDFAYYKLDGKNIFLK